MIQYIRQWAKQFEKEIGSDCICDMFVLTRTGLPSNHPKPENYFSRTTPLMKSLPWYHICSSNCHIQPHYKFHAQQSLLTTGGTICTLSGTKLKNHIFGAKDFLGLAAVGIGFGLRAWANSGSNTDE